MSPERWLKCRYRPDKHLSSATAGETRPERPLPGNDIFATLLCSLHATPKNEPLHGSPSLVHEPSTVSSGSRDFFRSIRALSSAFPRTRCELESATNTHRRRK
ncbi:hypothetical protein V8G54_013720 [Vigna mungo]|uniref:Uncharacterized protein n=1 Tax=Vigna mungo TaxID=3915 RepID=A0AAQ3NHS4_VIGMU